MKCTEDSPFVLVSSPPMNEFGDELCCHLNTLGAIIPHYKLELTTFANGEILPHIPHTIRHQHVFFLHALQQPDPNTAMMTLLLANDAMRRAAASGITLVLPYIPYLRQDRKDKPRVPISARMIADLIESNDAVKGVITIDMHAEQEQGFFSVPVDNLTGIRVFSEHVREKFGDNLPDLVMLAPDFGGAVRNRRFAHTLGDIPVSILEKRRTGANKAEILNVIGESVEGKIVIMYEDMIDTGGTAIKSITKLMEEKKPPRQIYLCATHGIFSGNAKENFRENDIRVACTDSIPRLPIYYAIEHWLTKVSIASYFADAIFEAMQMGGSISKLSQ